MFFDNNAIIALPINFEEVILKKKKKLYNMFACITAIGIIEPLPVERRFPNFNVGPTNNIKGDKSSNKARN